MFNTYLAVTPPTVANDTFDNIIQSIIDAFPVATITGIMASIITGAAPFALLYWGARKVVRATFSAVKKGRVRI